MNFAMKSAIIHIAGLAAATIAPAGGAAGADGSRAVLELPPGPGNPRNSEGDLLALWNDHGARPEMKSCGPEWAHGARTPLAAAISRDEGGTWGAPRLLEDDPDGWFCYTAIQPLADGTVLLGYCAYGELAHSRIANVPGKWLYGE